MTATKPELVEVLAHYADYHRDWRNVATHLVGIPMIVFALVVLLSGSPTRQGAMLTTFPMLVTAVLAVFYIRLDWWFGLVLTGLLIGCCLIGIQMSALPDIVRLSWGAGLFVAGWVMQFIGHAFEGRKPAFLDDLKSLLIGPLFVLAEVAFAFGLRRELQAALKDK